MAFPTTTTRYYAGIAVDWTSRIEDGIYFLVEDDAHEYWRTATWEADAYVIRTRHPLETDYVFMVSRLVRAC